MAATIAENANALMFLMYDDPEHREWTGPQLERISGLTPAQINDAMAILESYGYVEWMKFLGTAPFDFGFAEMTPRGRFEVENRIKVMAMREAYGLNNKAPEASPEPESSAPSRRMPPPTSPVGSPYGFTDEDWEIVTARKGASDQLNVVLGCRFKSPHYDTELLVANIRAELESALVAYNQLPNAIPASLNFIALHAGYGEHVFNEIARDIIASDIAVFDTSDLNPNVMLELGVALTWGVRVLVIRAQGCPQPPSDIWGQTWAEYSGSGKPFMDPQHQMKLLRMVERAVRKKAAA